MGECWKKDAYRVGAGESRDVVSVVEDPCKSVWLQSVGISPSKLDI